MGKKVSKNPDYQKSRWRWICLPLGIISLAVLLERVAIGFLTRSAGFSAHTVGIIGGADGPTAVYITSASETGTGSQIAAGILLILSIFGFYKLSHIKNERDT